MMVLSKGRVIFMGISVASAYTVWGLLISLQPPFYPQEAEKKGASPSQVIHFEKCIQAKYFYSIFVVWICIWDSQPCSLFGGPILWKIWHQNWS